MTTLVRLAKRARGNDVDRFRREVARNCEWPSGVGLRSATQALTLPGAYRAGEPVFDVVDELVFDDERHAAVFLANARVRRLWADPLLDEVSIATLIVDLHVAKPGAVPTSYVKNYEIVTKLPAMDRAEFDRYWIEVHGPLAAGIPTIRRYVQAHLAPGFRDSGQAPFDGLAITWFDDVAEMRAGTQSAVYDETRADEANFLAGELPFIITTERVVLSAPNEP